MRHEIIKLNSEQEYKDILKFLKDLGESVYDTLKFHSEWNILAHDGTDWKLCRQSDFDKITNFISYSEFISKYSKKKETTTTGLGKYKVYIKGHKTRGTEVIKKLESLGGKNLLNLEGWATKSCYYINNSDHIRDKEDLDLTDRTEIFLDEPINEPIDKIEVFPGIYVGDVVVSLEIKNHYRKKGDIFKVSKESKKNVLYYSSYRVSSDIVDGWRLATSEEKEAFEKGITNINDIKKEPEEDFSKFIGQWVTYHKWSGKSVCKVTKIQKRESKDYYKIYFDNGYIHVNPSTCSYWSTDSKNLKILSKEELKEYLPKDVYMKEFPETVKSTSLQDYLNSIPDTFTGYLEGFPKEIVQKIVERQVEQKNESDYTVFEKELCASKKSKGFDWMESKEGYDFWKEVILYKHFNLFYEKYPKTETKVTTTNIYNVEGDIYGILTSDNNITTIGTKDYIIPIVKHSHISTNSRYVIDDGRYVKEHFIKDHELNESYQKNSLENKTTTFEHLPFIQVKPLEIF
jgi:hypothetical protein